MILEWLTKIIGDRDLAMPVVVMIFVFGCFAATVVLLRVVLGPPN